MGENIVRFGVDLGFWRSCVRMEDAAAGHLSPLPAPCERNPPALLVKYTRGCSNKKFIKNEKFTPDRSANADGRMVRVSGVRSRPACRGESEKISPTRPGTVLSWPSQLPGTVMEPPR